MSWQGTRFAKQLEAQVPTSPGSGIVVVLIESTSELACTNCLCQPVVDFTTVDGMARTVLYVD